MISNFFNKSKPIHLVVISIILLMVFSVVKYFAIKEPLDVFQISKVISVFFVVLFSVFLLDFLVSRNSLTKKNSYKILFFTLFICLFPETLLNTKILLANLCILLSLRRLISLRSSKDIKKKLFDAAFWITVASLLYFWASLYFILIFIALIVFSITDPKNWIVPIIGIITVLVICVSYMVLVGVDFIDYFNSLVSLSFDFSQLNSKRIIIASTILFSFGLWSLIHFLKHIKSKSKKYRPSFTLIIISILIGMLIIVFAPIKNGSEFIFLFAPLAIIMTNYFETISEKWFKEVFILVLIITPIATLML